MTLILFNFIDSELSYFFDKALYMAQGNQQRQKVKNKTS
jgi:hypothetical protein